MTSMPVRRRLGTRSTVAQWVGFKPEEEDQVIVISEYTGGGFGGKIPGAQSMAIPAVLSKKAGGRPVQMRISREEENYIGRARPGIHLRARIGFRKDGRIIAMDFAPSRIAGRMRTRATPALRVDRDVAVQPETMRFRAVVLTNTPRVAQRAPGGEQASAMLEPLVKGGAPARRRSGRDSKITAPRTGWSSAHRQRAVATTKAAGRPAPGRTSSRAAT
jgi:CO/xanthine dehydrogenase Mo-binding subunit